MYLYVMVMCGLQIRDDESVSMQLLLGYIGLFNAVLLSPVLVALVRLNALLCEELADLYNS